jgi:hypothetical protein
MCWVIIAFILACEFTHFSTFRIISGVDRAELGTAGMFQAHFFAANTDLRYNDCTQLCQHT